MLLGCLATDLVCAIELAGVLTRSAIPVTVHTTLPAEPLASNDSSPFHILVLNPTEDLAQQQRQQQQLEQAVGWLRDANAKRIALIHPRQMSDVQRRATAGLADGLLTFASHDGADTMCHCERAITSPALERYLLLPMNRLSADVVQSGAGDIADFIQSFSKTAPLMMQYGAPHPSAAPTHLILKATTDNDFLNVIRGSERISVLCGTPDLALHLPALFRVRGWLTSVHQSPPFEHEDSSPRLLCGPLSSCPPPPVQHDLILNTEQDSSPVTGLGTSYATKHELPSEASIGALTAQSHTLQAWLSVTIGDEKDQPITLCTFTQSPDTWSVSTIQVCESRSSQLLLSRASVPRNSALATMLKLGRDYVSEA